MRYAHDARWITTRYPARCRGCRRPIGPGERALWWPRQKATSCRGCGTAETHALPRESQDEDLATGG